MGTKKLKLITKMPETTKLAKKLIKETAPQKETLMQVKFKTAQGKESLYSISEKTISYNGIPLRASVCYSDNLKAPKTKTITKHALSKLEELKKLGRKYEKRKFACKEDALKEKSVLEHLPLIKK